MKTNSSTSSSDVLKKLIRFLPIVVLLVIVNFSVDPVSLYHKDPYDEAAAEIMVSGHHVGNETNVRDVYLQKYLIEKIPSAPETIILGSSRSMQIGENVFPKGSVLNHSVSSATILDFLGVFYGYEKRGIYPQKCVLGLDPWIFNANNGFVFWEMIEDDAINMAKVIGSSEHAKHRWLKRKWLNLISPSYFQRSLKTLGHKKEIFFPTDMTEADYPIRLSDGRISYRRAQREKSEAEVTMTAIRSADEVPFYGFNRYNEMSPDLQEGLEKLVEHLSKKREMEVTFFLPPFHPETYARLVKRPDTKIILQVEKKIRALAKKHGIRILGSYDPSLSGLDRDDFYDGFHPKGKGIEKIFL